MRPRPATAPTVDHAGRVAPAGGVSRRLGALALRRRVAAPLLLTAAVFVGGCLPPGAGTAIERGVAEARGGRGELQEVSPLPPGQILDRYRSVRVLPVERSPDGGPIPGTLLKVLEAVLVNGIRQSSLFPGSGTPTLVLRVRLTTYWPADGISQALSAYSEILALVEFLEERRRAPLGVYYARGFSTAIKRKAEEDLSIGLTSAVLEVMQKHHAPPPDKKK
jgi:hypothetical protein